MRKQLSSIKDSSDIDPAYAEACSNLGLVYLLQAQEYADKAPADINDLNYATAQAEIKKFYEAAKPYYEKARELKPDQKRFVVTRSLPGILQLEYGTGIRRNREK